ncbi:MAG TPA: papain-like cysteine protease family protein [Candidatus Limnocylindrales bacterium]
MVAPPPRRRRRLLQALGALGLALAVVGTTAVWTDTLGAGDRWERILDRVDRFIAGPVPDRPSVPTVVVTPRPILAPTARPTRAPTLPPLATPEPSPTPEPTPARVPVDVDMATDPDAAFSHEIKNTWCAPAGITMVLALYGQVTASDDIQREIAGRVHEFESYDDSHNGGWGPASMSEALAAYGVPGYEVHAFETREDALRGSAVAIEATGAPVVLLAWRGAHTWVMTGFRADADPAIFPDAVVSGAYILDPWYPDISSIWGPSDPPGTFQDEAEMVRNFLPWKRPEGKYPDRDGRFIVMIPTLPLGG